MMRRAALLVVPVLLVWCITSPGTVERLFSRTGTISANSREALTELRMLAAGATGLAALGLWALGSARMRALGPKLALCGSTTLGMLAFAELATRATLSDPTYPEHRLAEYRPSSDAQLVFELIPQTDNLFEGVRYRVNRQGFRGPDWPGTPCRLMLVGDSLVYGNATPEDEVCWRRMEAELRARHGPTTWVAALGVGGYGTFQERRLMEVFAPRVKPTQIVLLFCMNDVDDPYRHVKVTQPITFSERALPDGPRPAPPARAPAAPVPPAAAGPAVEPRWGAAQLVHHVLWRFSRFYVRVCLAGDALLNRARAPDLPPRPGLDWEDCLIQLCDQGSPKSQWLAGQLAAIKALGDTLHCPVAVAVAPLRSQVVSGNRFARAPQETVLALCRRAGLACRDLSPAIVAGGGEALFVDQCHFSSRGHAVVAAELLALVDQSAPGPDRMRR